MLKWSFTNCIQIPVEIVCIVYVGGSESLIAECSYSFDCTSLFKHIHVCKYTTYFMKIILSPVDAKFLRFLFNSFEIFSHI